MPETWFKDRKIGRLCLSCSSCLESGPVLLIDGCGVHGSLVPTVLELPFLLSWSIKRPGNVTQLCLSCWWRAQSKEKIWCGLGLLNWKWTFKKERQKWNCFSLAVAYSFALHVPLTKVIIYRTLKWSPGGSKSLKVVSVLQMNQYSRWTSVITLKGLTSWM